VGLHFKLLNVWHCKSYDVCLCYHTVVSSGIHHVIVILQPEGTTVICTWVSSHIRTLIKAFFFTLNEFFLAEVTCIEQSRSSTDCSINFVFVSFVSFHDTAPGGGGGSSWQSFIQGGSARRLKPLPFNTLIFTIMIPLFIYLEQNCTPFLYLKDEPKQ